MMTSKKGVKIVLCHDMKGGYLEDHFIYGYNKKLILFLCIEKMRLDLTIGIYWIYLYTFPIIL